MMRSSRNLPSTVEAAGCNRASMLAPILASEGGEDKRSFVAVECALPGITLLPKFQP